MAAAAETIRGIDPGAPLPEFPEGSPESAEELTRLRSSLFGALPLSDMLGDGVKMAVTGVTGSDKLVEVCVPCRRYNTRSMRRSGNPSTCPSHSARAPPCLPPAQLFDGVEALFETGKFALDMETSIRGKRNRPLDVEGSTLRAAIDSPSFWEGDADEKGRLQDAEASGLDGAAAENAPSCEHRREAYMLDAGGTSPGGVSRGEDGTVDGFVVVDRGDLVDAIGHFLAVYIASDPRAAGMTPGALQEAISVGLKEVKGSGLLKNLWVWGKVLYRISTTGMALFQVYSHPWIVRGVLQVAWVTGKFLAKR